MRNEKFSETSCAGPPIILQHLCMSFLSYYIISVGFSLCTIGFRSLDPFMGSCLTLLIVFLFSS